MKKSNKNVSCPWKDINIILEPYQGNMQKFSEFANVRNELKNRKSYL